MSDLERIITVELHDKKYSVVGINHNGNNIPIVLDHEIYKIIRHIKRKWYINDRNHVFCFDYKNGDKYVIYLHDIVMKLYEKQNYVKRPIVHINNIHFDNRIENLQYDSQSKDYSKITKKKRRTIDLSEYHINVDDLPTYLWYLKPDKTHGERFIVEIKDYISWRSTSSKRLSLRYKLEEAKKYLRHIKAKMPQIFEIYSMNGDLTKYGLQLYEDFYKIIKIAGYTMNLPSINNTDWFIQKDTSGLSRFEIFILNNYEPERDPLDIDQLWEKYKSGLSDNISDL
jgi:hypothetical protein